MKIISSSLFYYVHFCLDTKTNQKRQDCDFRRSIFILLSKNIKWLAIAH